MARRGKASRRRRRARRKKQAINNRGARQIGYVLL